MLKSLSIEGCGNGSEFLHQRDVPDTSHFRARYSLYDQNMINVQWNIDMGLGFVEYQLEKIKSVFHLVACSRTGRNIWIRSNVLTIWEMVALGKLIHQYRPVRG